MSVPFASCVLIFLDAERFLDEAIRSVVGQVGCDDWELVLVDDGSTDASTAIAARWAATDPRIHYVDHPGHTNLGMSAARNAGLAAARGRYVGFLDSDDLWLPSRLAHTRRVLAAHPGAAVVIGGTWRWHGWTGVPADIARDHPMSLPAVPLDATISPPDLFAAMYREPGWWRIPAMCSLLIDRRALMDMGGMEADFRGLYEDQVLYTKIALRLPVVVDARPVALYRQHPDSACERSVSDGTWRRDGPSDPASTFLRWMLDYAESTCGAGSEQADIVRHNISHGAWSPVLPSPRWPWLPDPIRRAVRSVRERRRPPAQGVIAAWSEQVVRVAISAMGGGRVLVAGGSAHAREPWVDRVPSDAWPDADVVEGDLTAGGSYDHVIALAGATRGRDPASLVRMVAEQVRPGGSAAVVVGGPMVRVGAGALVAELDGVMVSVETFGNASTRAAVTDGVPAAAVGVELDRHDPSCPVLAAVTVEVRA